MRGSGSGLGHASISHTRTPMHSAVALQWLNHNHRLTSYSKVGRSTTQRGIRRAGVGGPQPNLLAPPDGAVTMSKHHCDAKCDLFRTRRVSRLTPHDPSSVVPT